MLIFLNADVRGEGFENSDTCGQGMGGVKKWTKIYGRPLW